MLASVKGGLFETAGQSYLVTAHTTRGLRRKAATALGMRGQLYFRELMSKLNGAAPGVQTDKKLARVAATEDLSGVRPIELEVLCAGPTTANHKNLIDNNILSRTTKTTFGNSPPPNLDGNPLGTR
jgi:hypothetical protein